MFSSFWTPARIAIFVQIFNQDESQVLTTILAIPNYRLKATDKNSDYFP